MFSQLKLRNKDIMITRCAYRNFYHTLEKISLEFNIKLQSLCLFVITSDDRQSSRQNGSALKSHFVIRDLVEAFMETCVLLSVSVLCFASSQQWQLCSSSSSSYARSTREEKSSFFLSKVQLSLVTSPLSFFIFIQFSPSFFSSSTRLVILFLQNLKSVIIEHFI